MNCPSYLIDRRRKWFIISQSSWPYKQPYSSTVFLDVLLVLLKKCSYCTPAMTHHADIQEPSFTVSAESPHGTEQKENGCNHNAGGRIAGNAPYSYYPILDQEQLTSADNSGRLNGPSGITCATEMSRARRQGGLVHQRIFAFLRHRNYGGRFFERTWIYCSATCVASRIEFLTKVGMEKLGKYEGKEGQIYLLNVCMLSGLCILTNVRMNKLVGLVCCW